VSARMPDMCFSPETGYVLRHFMKGIVLSYSRSIYVIIAFFDE
jgi:hypothetical protein